MTLWDTLMNLLHPQASGLTQVVLPDDHVSPATPDTSAAVAGESYFRLWVVGMHLRRDRGWFRSFYPVVQSLTTFDFGGRAAVEVAQIAGPRLLRDLDEAHLDRVVRLDHALTPLAPFNGGTVQIEAGLIAFRADDTLARFLDVMGTFAGLLATPPLSAALTLAGPISSGIQQLLSAGAEGLALGYARTYAGAGGGGPNDLRPAYIAIIGAASGQHDPAQLWVRDGTLLAGPTPDRAQPLTDADHMLLRIETRTHRDDWEALTAIAEPWARAIDALQQVDAAGNPRVADADAFVRSAAVAALASHDLTARDRTQVARAIRDRYRDYRAVLEADDSGGRGDVRLPQPPTLTDVCMLAPAMDASPVAVGALFAE